MSEHEPHEYARMVKLGEDGTWQESVLLPDTGTAGGCAHDWTTIYSRSDHAAYLIACRTCGAIELHKRRERRDGPAYRYPITIDDIESAALVVNQ